MPTYIQKSILSHVWNSIKGNQPKRIKTGAMSSMDSDKQGKENINVCLNIGGWLLWRDKE